MTTNDLQDQAFKQAHLNPTSDHDLLTFFDTGDFIYNPDAPVKSPEDYEAEKWDHVSLWKKVKAWVSSFRG